MPVNLVSFPTETELSPLFDKIKTDRFFSLCDSKEEKIAFFCMSGRTKEKAKLNSIIRKLLKKGFKNQFVKR